MDKEHTFKKFQGVMMVVFSVVAILILVDYRFTKETIVETISKTTRELENKYSVARNYYYAYYVQTENETIPVSKEFRSKVEQNTQVSIEKSLLFNEINKVTLLDTKEDEVYSFRIASGLLLPCLVLLIIGIGYKLKNRVNTLVFASQVVLLGDFIFLLF